MLIKVNNKEEAFRSVINMWLSDKRSYCNVCGKSNDSEKPSICCENPQVGTNRDHCYALIKQNKEIIKSRLNDFSSNQSNTMRWGLSLPPTLYQFLKKYCDMHNHNFLKSSEELNWFMKKFPMFKTCNRI